MKNKKGFTLMELLAVFVIMAFLLGIGIVSYNYIIDRVSANYYDTLEEELLLAGSDYFTNNRIERPLSGYSAVQIDELVGDKYIETLKDRKGNVCDYNDKSKVYIYKTSDGYGYEACLFCNEYEPVGTYCKGLALGVINISASKADGSSYNPLLSFANASWSNSDVNVKFSVTVDVSKFVITDTSDGSTRICDSISNRSCSMSFSETSSYKVQAYNNGVEVAPAKSFNIKTDKEAPQIAYSLEAGTYDEEKMVTVTVTDDGKIKLIEYELYRDDTLISRGNPTITSETSVSFNNTLDSSGTWKLNVTTVDGGGNTTSDSRDFVINMLKCEWVEILSSSPNNCTSISQPSNPVEGDRYVECDGPKYGNWRYSLSSGKCVDGRTIYEYTSTYDYNSSLSAEGACYGRLYGTNGCGTTSNGVVSGGKCTTSQLKYYYKDVYEYQCK